MIDPTEYAQQLRRCLDDIVECFEEFPDHYELEVDSLMGVSEVVKIDGLLAEALDRARFVLYEQEPPEDFN
jgi:hypothetical protein